MKTINKTHIVLFFLVMLLGFGCGNGYKQGTPEKLGESFYLALKNNDPEGYRTLLVQDHDLETMMEISEDWKEKPAEEIRGEFEWSMRNLDKEVKEGFAKMREKVVEKGGDWENLDYKGVDVKKDTEDGFQTARVRVYFASNGIDFELDGKECADLDGKWVGGDMGKIRLVK